MLKQIVKSVGLIPWRQLVGWLSVLLAVIRLVDWQRLNSPSVEPVIRVDIICVSPDEPDEVRRQIRAEINRTMSAAGYKWMSIESNGEHLGYRKQ